ncbi:hypothetical protein M9458_037218, partial [Cirrhinus mrigala]
MISVARTQPPRVNTAVSHTHSIRDSRSPLISDARPSLSHSAPVCPVNSLSVSSTYVGVAQNTEGGAPRPLIHFASAWCSITGISEWIRNVIENGYTLQFQRRPPRFNGMVMSTVPASSAPVLRQEVLNLLTKHAIEVVPPSERKSGFYSRYFIVPKKGGGLRSILDLRPVNHALYKRAFKMTTLKQILGQIRLGDWFVDLKDTYFHIQIAPRHRCFLRFAFEGTAYQFMVMPFGLALVPRTFT